MSWTKDQLYRYARANNLTMSELGQRGGRKAARLKAKRKQKTQSQLTLAL